MGDPWGIGVLGGGEGLEGANRKKKTIGGKSQKSENNFSTGNGSKSIRNFKKSI